MATNHFNELLLQTLKEISIHLDRLAGRIDRVEQRMDHLDGRIDRIIDQKADKSDLAATNKRLDSIESKLDQKADKADLVATNEKLDTLGAEVRSHGQRLDRIESGIRTLQWTMSAGLAVMGVIFAFLRAC